MPNRPLCLVTRSIEFYCGRSESECHLRQLIEGKLALHLKLLLDVEQHI